MQMSLFAAKVMGPRRKACFTPLESQSPVFLKPAEEKNMNSTITYFQHIQGIISTCVAIKVKIKRPLLGVVALYARMQTSLHISPMM